MNTLNFDDAPGGDLNLDDIFGDSQPSTTMEPQQKEPPEPAPETTPQSTEPVIKTKTGTVYKTMDDAVQGIEHKDTLIAQLREQVRQQTGTDPLAARKPAPTTQPTGPKSYIEDQEQYFEDIADAVSKKDTKAYMATQQKLIWDSLGPLAPTITSLAKANAERVVVQEVPDFKDFLNSEQFSQLGQTSPLLAEAIRTAEMNPQAANQLPELYKVAYYSSQGRRVPELLQSARAEAPPIPPRPTVHSTSLTPPPNSGAPQVQPGMDTKDGRQALIKQMEDRGIGNQRW
jgi:hypothetical protein